MGASASVDLRQEDIAEIEDITVYEPKEIKSLYKRFMRLDAGKKGTLAVEDLLMVPEVSMNPLAGRLTSLFARDADGRINFRSFAAGLSAFSERARTDVRKRAVFRLYDVDGDGYINDADLHAVLRMIAGKAVQPAGVADEVVARTMAAADRDGDGRISFEDFDAVRVRTRAHVCEDGRREQSRARLPRASRARARAAAWLPPALLPPRPSRPRLLCARRAWPHLTGPYYRRRSSRRRAGKGGTTRTCCRPRACPCRRRAAACPTPSSRCSSPRRRKSSRGCKRRPRQCCRPRCRRTTCRNHLLNRRSRSCGLAPNNSIFF